MKPLWLKLKLPPSQTEVGCRPPAAPAARRWYRSWLPLLFACTWLVGCQSHLSTTPPAYSDSGYPAGLSSAALKHIDSIAIDVKRANDNAGQAGYEIVSGPYRIFTTIGNSTQQHLIALVLRDEWRQFHYLLPSVHPLEPLRGYLFAHHRQWANFTRQVMGKSAGYYVEPGVNGYDRGVMFALYLTTIPALLSVMAHEAWHQFSYVGLKDHLPAWMDEGLATQFEAVCWRHGKPYFDSALNYPRWLALRAVCRRGEFIPLHIFLRISAGAALAAGPRMTQSYYAQVWSFMLFLTIHDGWHTIKQAVRSAHRGALTSALLAAGLSESDLTHETGRWNLIAGPLFFRCYFAQHPKYIFNEYRRFARRVAAHWPPRIPSSVIAHGAI